jgi:hypothetical protein
METTGKQLIEHWKWSANEGFINPNTASALRAACTQVLAVYNDWETRDVSELNVEETIGRFKEERVKEFTPSSLQVYASRFRQAISSFLQYVRNPESWKANSRVRGGSGRGSSQVLTARVSEESRVYLSTVSAHQNQQAAGEMIEYPCPLLRENMTARVMVPRDLRKEDVERIHRLLMAICVDS